MAITKVRVKINGVWSNLALNSSTGKWEGTITAPATTSYNQSGGYWPVTVEATNSAGYSYHCRCDRLYHRGSVTINS